MNFLTKNVEENIELVKTIANSIYPTFPLLAKLTAAQAILESGLTGMPSDLAIDYNNLFGITDKPGTHNPNIVTMPTFEYINGVRTLQMRKFSWNNSVDDSFLQHKEVLDLPRYSNLKTATTFEEIATMIREDGYATDPNYSTSLINIANKYL